jgi:hypothetical protein
VICLVHAVQGALRVSAECPQDVRTRVPRSVVMALESFDCRATNQSRRVRRARKPPLSTSTGALEAPIGLTPAVWPADRARRRSASPPQGASQRLSDADDMPRWAPTRRRSCTIGVDGTCSAVPV